MNALFILIRNDMDSMDFERSCFLTSQITKSFIKKNMKSGERPSLSEGVLRFTKVLMLRWLRANFYDFNKLRVYGVSEQQLKDVNAEISELLRVARSEMKMPYKENDNPLYQLGIYDIGLVEDEFYGITRNDSTHPFPLVGGYIFGDAELVADELFYKNIKPIHS